MIGAVVFRAIFVSIGAGLLTLGPWVELVFRAGIVGWTAVMMLKKDEEDDEIEDYSTHCISSGS